MTAIPRRRFLKTAALAAGMTTIATQTAESRDRPSGASHPGTAPWIAHDLHTHTVYSDGAQTIPLLVFEARAFELEAVAVTDHYTPGSKLYQSQAEFDRYLAEIDRERKGQSDVLVLKGAEATVLDVAGRISLDPQHAERLEWVLCDLGGQSEGTLRNTPSDKRRYAENVVRTYLALCDVEYLNVIAHPFNTGNTRPPLAPAEYPERLLRELASKMAAKGKVFDVMNDSAFWQQKSGIGPREMTAQYVELVKLFAAEKVRFQVSSDDHRTGLGNTHWSQLVLQRAGVPPNQIVQLAELQRLCK
jgi:histidinol phosphatase-like PHP family hydrolase